MNRKQRRQMYKKYPKMREIIKKQKDEAIKELEAAFQKKWQKNSEICLENKNTNKES